MAERNRGLRLPGWIADFAVATVVGVVLGLLGPFGTFLDGSVWQRVGYWTAMAWIGFGVFSLFGRLVPPRPSSPSVSLAALVLYTALAAAPFALLSWWLAHAMWPQLRAAHGLTPVVWYLESLTITASQVALFATLRRRQRVGGGRGRAPLVASFLGVAPAEVICLQMEDHYIRVHTASGSRMVLGALADAMVMLGATPGMQVHRSWWAADRAVVGAVAEGRNLRLLLSNGLSAPVARSRVAAVRAAGWLDRAASDPALESQSLFG